MCPAVVDRTTVLVSAETLKKLNFVKDREELISLDAVIKLLLELYFYHFVMSEREEDA